MKNTKGAYCWNIEKVISKGDYNYALVREHPNATKHGYVLEHRVIVENHLNRILEANEVVHHKNRNKKDNKIENLEVLTAEEHRRLHGREVGHKMITLKCPQCSVLFDREERQTFLKKKGRYTCCSRQCRGKFSRFIQLHGETAIVQNAISENIQKSFVEFLDNAEETNHRVP